MGNISINKVAEFLKDSANFLYDNQDKDYVNWLEFDYGLALWVGWESGYDPSDYGVTPDGYAVCAKIADTADALPDYMFAYMPYSENGDVWDTDMQINNYSSISEAKVDAEWYVDQYYEIIDEYKAGNLIIPGMEPYDDDDELYDNW